jgi:Tfp pilus assembly protein PilO
MALDVKKGLGDVKVPTVPWHKLSKLSRAHKIIISVAILGALWGSFVWFFYMPQTEKIARLDQDLKSAHDKLARLKNVEQNLRDFKKEFKETEEKFREALKFLPDNEEIPVFQILGPSLAWNFFSFNRRKRCPKTSMLKSH